MPVESKNCWKEKGVWGHGSPKCEYLEEVIHCRNCDVFHQAGRSLLECELPEDYMQEWADLMAAKKIEEQAGALSVVIFRIKTEWLAMRTKALSAIIDSEELRTHSLPHRKSPVLMGIININGEIQLYISLHKLLGIETGDQRQEMHQRMIVANSSGGKWVFPVNEIFGIYRIHPEYFQNVPVTVAKSQNTFTQSIFHFKKMQVAFLDDELLFYGLTRSVQ